MADIYAWNRNMIAHFANNGGTRSSAESSGDSDADKDDPRIFFDAVKTMASIPELNTSGIEKEHRRAIKYCVLALYNLAVTVNHGQRVIIFGRDMYPFLAFRKEIGHKLRGRWHYAEGISRKIVGKYNGFFAEYTYGVDTGFSGTIPCTALGTENSSRIRLLSSDYTERRIMNFKPTNWDARYDKLRKMVVDMEHMPKPFLRCTEVEKIGEYIYPILRTAANEDCLYAGRVWDYTRAMTNHYYPVFQELLKLPDNVDRSELIADRLNLKKN